MIVKNWREYVSPVNVDDINELEKEMRYDGWLDEDGNLELTAESLKKFWQYYDIAFLDELLELIGEEAEEVL